MRLRVLEMGILSFFKGSHECNYFNVATFDGQTFDFRAHSNIFQEGPEVICPNIGTLLLYLHILNSIDSSCLKTLIPKM
jgi:hypothetical protein